MSVPKYTPVVFTTYSDSSGVLLSINCSFVQININKYIHSILRTFQLIISELSLICFILIF